MGMERARNMKRVTKQEIKVLWCDILLVFIDNTESYLKSLQHNVHSKLSVKVSVLPCIVPLSPILFLYRCYVHLCPLTTAHWHWMIFVKAPRQYSSHQTGSSHGGDAEGSATLCQWASGSCMSMEHTAFIFNGPRSSRPRKMANDSQPFFLDCLALQTKVKRTILQDTENRSPNHTVSYPRRHKPVAY
jgi:hypothetical protein